MAAGEPETKKPRIPGIRGLSTDSSASAELAPDLLVRTSRLDHLLQLAGLIEIGHDIATAHQFPIDIKLGERRPIGVHLQVLTHIGMLKNIHEREFFTASHQRLYG